jgi:hypothetical protein
MSNMRLRVTNRQFARPIDVIYPCVECATDVTVRITIVPYDGRQVTMARGPLGSTIGHDDSVTPYVVATCSAICHAKFLSRKF